MNPALIELVLDNDRLADLDPAARRLALRDLVAENGPVESFAAQVRALSDAIDGFGPITELMDDASVTDILVNGPEEVWVERHGRLHRTSVTFDLDMLMLLIRRLVGEAGERADITRPIAGARLPDGSRFHVVLPPLARYGPVVSIRKFPEQPFSLEDLVTAEMLGDDEAIQLREAVVARDSILISGGTGTGKTTLLNALLGLVPDDERVVIVEELPELRPVCAHAVSLTTRSTNVEGKGAVTLRDLVRAALRMRPDRIVVGEVRGGEAHDALAAMSTGHGGSLLTVHARSAAAALDRVVSLAMEAGSGESEVLLHRRAEEAVDMFVHLARRDGRRRVVALEHSR